MQWIDSYEYIPPFPWWWIAPVVLWTDDSKFTLFFSDRNLPEDSGQNPTNFPAQLMKQDFTVIDGTIEPTGDLISLIALPHNYAPISVERLPNGRIAVLSGPNGISEA